MATSTLCYRQTAVMLASAGIAALTLSRFALLVQSRLLVPYNWKLELLIVCGQVFFQWFFIYKHTMSRKLVYAYNLLQLSLFGSILLWPILLLNRYVSVEDTWNLMYFFGVVFILFMKHYEKVKQLELPPYLCLTWAAYRFMILLLIL